MENYLRSWSASQLRRLSELKADSTVTIAFWASSRGGYACNGGSSDGPAYPGKVEEIPGPLEICTSRGLHATSDPLKWKGDRVWVVALFGNIETEEDNIAGLKREILGEIRPHEAWNDRLKARLGQMNLPGADLSGANFSGVNLSGVNFSGAKLERANFSRAKLCKANLSGADLYKADFFEADLSDADLSGSNLQRACLKSYAPRVNLSRSDLTWANLTCADLRGADLSYVNLHGADLSDADLSGGSLWGANMRWVKCFETKWPVRNYETKKVEEYRPTIPFDRTPSNRRTGVAAIPGWIRLPNGRHVRTDGEL